MAEDNAHIQILMAARDTEIQHRREVARLLAAKFKKGTTEQARNLFMQIQSTIEAIERAIAHEEFIASKETSSSWPGAIGFGAGAVTGDRPTHGSYLQQQADSGVIDSPLGQRGQGQSACAARI
jgi:hypothetical protein